MCKSAAAALVSPLGVIEVLLISADSGLGKILVQRRSERDNEVKLACLLSSQVYLECCYQYTSAGLG